MGDLLAQEGYTAEEIFITVHADEDDRIYIAQIEILFDREESDIPQESQFEELTKQVEDVFGTRPIIGYLGGETDG